jgi:hypothetical protein
MNLLSLSLAALVAATPSLLHAKIERVVERSFPMSPRTDSCWVRTVGGDIRVKTDPQAAEVRKSGRCR